MFAFVVLLAIVSAYVARKTSKRRRITRPLKIFVIVMLIGCVAATYIDIHYVYKMM